jgi:hypothetical protein
MNHTVHTSVVLMVLIRVAKASGLGLQAIKACLRKNVFLEMSLNRVAKASGLGLQAIKACLR